MREGRKGKESLQTYLESSDAADVDSKCEKLICRPCAHPTSSKEERDESGNGLARQFITLALLESGTTIAMEILAALQFDIRACVPVCGYTLPSGVDRDNGKGLKSKMLYRMLCHLTQQVSKIKVSPSPSLPSIVAYFDAPAFAP